MVRDNATLREDYLRAILAIEQENGMVKSIDVARYLHVTKASVSIAVSLLTEKDLVVKAPDNSLRLTEAGREIAERAYARSCYIKQILLHVGVDLQTAEADASRIGRAISEESLQKLSAHFISLENAESVA